MTNNQKGFGLIGLLLAVIILGAIGAIGWIVYQQQNRSEDSKQSTVTNFEECKAAGYPIGESYPEQCFAPGQTFVNKIQNQDKVEKNYSELPEGLQKAILAEAKKDIPDCVKDDKIVDAEGKQLNISVTYKDNAALVPLGCLGGAVYFFGLEDGAWQKLVATQMAFDCDLLEKYDIPASWVGDVNATAEDGNQPRCFKGTELVTYP